MSDVMDMEHGGEPDVAIVGMAGRFPGADDVDSFWKNVRGGVESISFFSDEQLLAAGTPAELVQHPDYVKGIGALRDVESFDAGFFGYSPREAEVLEPGHRLFLECAWEALESAGYEPSRIEGNVGVYAGAGSSGYTERHVRGNPELAGSVGEFQLVVGSGKDFLSTRVSYKLDLRGPSLSVQTGCSTSLVAVHLACQALLHGECDMAMAGGTSVLVPQTTGYLWAHGGILSPDGHCRAFDAKSAGAQAGSGAGVVVLKRLEDALRDGDTIHAVVKGSAINNDGSVKVAYTAPSVEGQAAVIGEALAVAGVEPETIGYIEAHGTGTELGDPIEIAALTKAFRASTDRKQFCTVGSVKTNIGHLDTAAGIAGFIKAVLALEHRELPPTVHFESPNPKIDFASSPFFVSGELKEWKTAPGVPRRAGVSSFGIGGTNCHIVLEEAPAAKQSGPSRPWQIVPLSARSGAALDEATKRLADHLREHPEQKLADVAHTLQMGRRAFPARRMVVLHEGEDAAAVLAAKTPDRVVSGVAEAGHRSVAFMFPGLGDHYVNMSRGLYEREPVFRREMDRCAEILKPHLGFDLREVLYPGDAPAEPGAPSASSGFDMRRMLGRDAGGPDANTERLNRTEVAQPAVFAVSYALAQLWMETGIRPQAVIGHSLGEYTAACIAGVFSLEDALALVAERAKMIQQLPGGAMLAVSASPDAVRPFLTPDVAIATVNAPSLCVVAGPEDAVAALEEKLSSAGHVARRLATTHAFHSPMMQPVVAPFVDRVRKMKLSAPKIAFVSNVTGTWITAEQATDPEYWGRHLRETVRFEQGVAELLREPGRVLLECGPGQTLSTFVRQRPAAEGEANVAIVPSIRYPYDRQADQAFFLGALGRLWVAGVTPDWSALWAGEDRRRIALPTYPWERQRYWVEAPDEAQMALAPSRGKKTNAAEWLYVPTWRRSSAASLAPAAEPEQWIVLVDDSALAARVVAGLKAEAKEMIVVTVGDGFARTADGYSARPDSRDDLRVLVDSLPDTDGPVNVVHAWTLAADGASQARGYVSLLLLADALGRNREMQMRVVAVSSGVHEVTGSETIEPGKATLLAGALAVAQEHPNIAVRTVDVALPGDGGPDEETLARQIVDEVRSASSDFAVAYRGRRRWVRGFEQVRPGAKSALREGGVYVLTNGLNGRGALFATHLVNAAKARLVIFERAFPGRGAWDNVVAARPESDPMRQQIELVRAFEAEGSEVLILPVDSARPDEVEEGLAAAEARFGAVHGVLHSTALHAVIDFAGIGETKAGAWAAEVERVTRELDVMERALESRALDFCILDSSLAAVTGGVGIVRVAALNALTDAYAHRHNQTHAQAWTSVAWDRWGEPGDGLGDYFLGDEETGRALDAALTVPGEAQVLVSTGDLNLRVSEAAAPVRKGGEGGGYARPDLDVEYFAPTNETEERLAAMWQELLGIDRIGIHDDFFGLGGHSLLATQIISRVREMFQLELPLKAIFEAPTIARFAVLIEDAIIAELESLTEEEALELL
jgi:acyl transferase domain-containing protein/acyl carrier protein